MFDGVGEMSLSVSPEVIVMLKNDGDEFEELSCPMLEAEEYAQLRLCD